MSSLNINEQAATLTPAGVLSEPVEAVEIRSEPRVRSARYGFVDLLRGCALVVMIETHVMNAYLPIALKKGSAFFFWLSFVNGLVAPAFLFAAGFSLVLQSKSQWENWLGLRRPFWIQMRRMGFILLVAYYTHLQGFRLSRYLSNWGDSRMWHKTLQVDVLQCIVVSLLFIHLLIFVLRKRERLLWGTGIIAAAVALSTPWIWSQDFRGTVPLSMALFLNPHGTSLFPIFPWLSFVLAGACVSCLFLKSAENGAIPQFMRNAALAGFLMICAGLLLRNSPYALPGLENFYTTSPLYMMIRIGCVLLFMVFLYRLEAGGRWIPQPILKAGQESLVVYGVHLWLIYAFLRGRGLGPLLGRQAGYAACFLISGAIIVLMLLLAKYWNDLKKNHYSATRIGQAAVVLAMIVVFLLG